MSENSAEGTETATDTGAGTDDLAAIQAFLAETKLSPAQLKSRLADSRKWETRAKERADYDTVKAELEKVRAANLSQAEKDLEAARNEGRTTGAAEAAQKYGAALVQAEARGQLSGRGLDEARVKTLLDHLPAATFLTDGAIDSAALESYIDAIAPKSDARTGGTTWGSPAAFGQGQRSTTATDAGAAGLAEAQRRFAKPKSA